MSADDASLDDRIEAARVALVAATREHAQAREHLQDALLAAALDPTAGEAVNDAAVAVQATLAVEYDRVRQLDQLHSEWLALKGLDR